MKKIFIFVYIILLFQSCSNNNNPLVFKGGHSHNDYAQERPFYGAWENGMISIEADVFMRENKLLIGHTKDELDTSKTILNMYFEPIFQIWQKNKEMRKIILMIDIKDNGLETYKRLEKEIVPYHSILSVFSKGNIIKKAVTIIISGDRPIDYIKNQEKRFAFVDGRISDLNRVDSKLMPLISDDWNEFFSWDGTGKLPAEEQNKLNQFVDDAHKQNKMIRFWGISNNNKNYNNICSTLSNSKVDLIGTDKPELFKQYFNH